MRAAVQGAARSLRSAIANPAIRRVEAAYTGGIAGDWVLLVALLVVAYQAGGPLGVGILGLVRMLPATLTGTFAGVPAARFGSGRVLVAADIRAIARGGRVRCRSLAGRSDGCCVHRGGGRRICRCHGSARPVRPAAVPGQVARRARRGQCRVEPRRGRRHDHRSAARGDPRRVRQPVGSDGRGGGPVRACHDLRRRARRVRGSRRAGHDRIRQRPSGRR